MSESRFVAGLEVTARAAAIFVTIVYGTGFLIVAIHHAQYGIAQFDPLKPKIFSTGIVFVLLAALPTIAAFRTFQLFGFSLDDRVFSLVSKPENELARKIVIGISFLLAAQGLSFALTFLFEPFADPKPWGVTCLVVLAGLYITLGFLAKKYFDDHPGFYVCANLLLMVLYLVALYRFYDHRQLALLLWFYGVGMGAIVLSKWLRPEKIRQIEWEQRFPAIAVVLLTYSTSIYGHIKPSFGGGVPSPVALYLTGKTPISSTDVADVLLLEETDHGYYVLPNAGEKSAYFIRRDLVSAIHFQNKEK